MRSALCLVLLIAGCTDNSKKVCNYGAAPPIADVEYRDPTTGQCQSFGTTYPCDPACGQLCPATGAVNSAAPDWGMCYGSCDSLSEAQCLASPTCHAAYSDTPTPSPTFQGCWALPPTGPITGACTGLDAQTCSEHTDCVSLMTSAVNSGSNFQPSFESCQPEPTTSLCGATSCGTGSECVVTPTMPMQQMCVAPATAGTCDAATCASPAPGCPTGTTPGVANGCYTNYCIPTSECAPAACSTLTEQQCKARSDCDPTYMGTNCTCDRNGCVCQSETYLSCQ
jgi:hypothetical protein